MRRIQGNCLVKINPCFCFPSAAVVMSPWGESWGVGGNERFKNKTPNPAFCFTETSAVSRARKGTRSAIRGDGSSGTAECLLWKPSLVNRLPSKGPSLGLAFLPSTDVSDGEGGTARSSAFGFPLALIGGAVAHGAVKHDGGSIMAWACFRDYENLPRVMEP